MKRKLAAFAIVIPLALTLAACDDSKGETTPTEEVVVTEQSTDSPDVDEVTEEEIIEEEPKEDKASNPLGFGETYTWDNGLTVTISDPEEATLSEYAGEMYDLEAGTPTAFTVTLTNGTDKDVEAMMINTEMTSGGKESEAIFDSAAGFDLPTATVLPGKSLEWKIGFVVADPADMILTVSDVLDFDSDKVHFTN